MLRFLSAFLFAALLYIPIYAQAQIAAPARPDILELMEISGEIDSGTANRIAKQVEEINETPRIKAVLLTVNSPGGGVIASAAVLEEISKLRIPVVAWCDFMCASGGVYVMMTPTVKHISVRSETVSGSVGVVMQATRYNRLLNWAMIDSETYQSGSLKSAGAATHEPTAAEREYLQNTINNLAKRFHALVAKARPGITDWDAIKSARIFFGEEAVAIGLVDAVMTRDEAIAKAKELSGATTIYTRDEMRKMSKLAEDRSMTAPRTEKSPLDYIPIIMDQLGAAMSGETVTFSYRAPYRF